MGNPRKEFELALMAERVASRMIDIEPGLHGLAERQQLAGSKFLDYCEQRAGLNRQQANKVLTYYVKHKLVKLDAVSGQFHVKHGQFLEPEVLQRAANM